jgi:hypothetical protein
MEDTNRKIMNFVNWAKYNGWNIINENNNIKKLSENIIIRYIIPNEYKTFLENIKICTNKEDDIWFLCIDDYNGEYEGTLRWNEFETVMLEGTDDNNFKKKTKDYWNKHFPIIFNVKNILKYYAINIETQKIVCGNYTPGFIENKIVANNFEEFMEKIMNKEIEL